MEKQEKQIKEISKPYIPYLEKVDVTMQTYRKALYNCIADISEIIKNSAIFMSADIPSYYLLSQMLFGQVQQVEAFLADYKQIEEVV